MRALSFVLYAYLSRILEASLQGSQQDSEGREGCRSLGEWQTKPFSLNTPGWSRKGKAFQVGADQPCDAANFWFADFGGCWYAACPAGTISNNNSHRIPTLERSYRWPADCPCKLTSLVESAEASAPVAAAHGEVCNSDFKRCSAAANPLYTRTFSGGAFDSVSSGVYQIASSKSGCFDVQGFVCRPSSTAAAALAGISVKIGASKLAIINNTVFVNGTEANEPYPQNPELSLSHLTEDLLILQGCNNCAKLVHGASSLRRPSNASWTPQYDQDVSIDLGIEDVGDRGLCAGGNLSPVLESDVTFSDSEMEQLCMLCGTDCPIEKLDAPMQEDLVMATDEAVPEPIQSWEDWGKIAPECEIDGGDYVHNFDGAGLSLVRYMTSASATKSHAGRGLNWLVKSSSVKIQALYGGNALVSKSGAFVRALAVGGLFVQSNVLIVGSQADSVSWNGRAILLEIPSEFQVNGLIHARRVKTTPQVRNRKNQSPGVEVVLPQGVRLLAGRVSKHVNFAIRMNASAAQDGLCGNFNGDPEDDAFNLVEERRVLSVSLADSLF